jgi:hypothetical protein
MVGLSPVAVEAEAEAEADADAEALAAVDAEAAGADAAVCDEAAEVAALDAQPAKVSSSIAAASSRTVSFFQFFMMFLLKFPLELDDRPFFSLENSIGLSILPVHGRKFSNCPKFYDSGCLR